MATEHHVTFYRSLTDSTGHVRDVALDTIRIRRARDRERALQAAIKRFERSRRLASWKHLAHRCEIN